MLRSFDGRSAHTPSNTRSNAIKMMEVEEKDREISKLQQHISDLNKKYDERDIEMKKFESETKFKSIQLENTLNELVSQKNRLMREVETSKSKIQSLQKECGDKDRIIMSYVKSKDKKWAHWSNLN